MANYTSSRFAVSELKARPICYVTRSVSTESPNGLMRVLLFTFCCQADGRLYWGVRHYIIVEKPGSSELLFSVNLLSSMQEMRLSSWNEIQDMAILRQGVENIGIHPGSYKENLLFTNNLKVSFRFLQPANIPSTYKVFEKQSTLLILRGSGE